MPWLALKPPATCSLLLSPCCEFSAPFFSGDDVQVTPLRGGQHIQPRPRRACSRHSPALQMQQLTTSQRCAWVQQPTRPRPCFCLHPEQQRQPRPAAVLPLQAVRRSVWQTCSSGMRSCWPTLMLLSGGVPRPKLQLRRLRARLLQRRSGCQQRSSRLRSERQRRLHWLRKKRQHGSGWLAWPTALGSRRRRHGGRSRRREPLSSSWRLFGELGSAAHVRCIAVRKFCGAHIAGLWLCG